MPAVSKKQQQLFGIVHAYQTGRIPPGKVSDTIKRIAKTVSPDDVKKFATTTTANLKDIVRSPKYTEACLREIVETKTPRNIKGMMVDVFTAQLLTTVLDRLNEQNKSSLLNRPLNEMVAMSYKILSY